MFSLLQSLWEAARTGYWDELVLFLQSVSRKYGSKAIRSGKISKDPRKILNSGFRALGGSKAVKYTFTSQRVSLKLLVPSLTFHCLVCNVGLTQLVSLAMRISSDEHTFHDDDLDSRTPPARQISGHLLLLPPRSLICRQVQPAQFEGSRSIEGSPSHGERGEGSGGSGGEAAEAEPAEKEPLSQQEEEEGVFEIRDFTNASAFERLSHQISLAAKRWAAALQDAQMQAGSSEDVLQMKESFEHANFRYELFFHLAPLGAAEKKDRLGLHAFPTRAHRVQRWFGVRHFVFVSLHNHNIDIDSARTMLGAAALAVRSASFLVPLSCFVPIDGGRRRVLGELLDSRCRVVYTTDLQHTVSGSFDNLSGLADFFWQKLEANPEDPLNSLMVGARFTYSADTFDALPSARHGEDPVESCKLHCLWPSFPFGAFGDDSNFSELDARVAPFWKLRVLRKDSTSLPLTGRLRSLLNFRKEALTVRSAEHSLQPAVPKTAMASLTATIQESLESILLPTAGEMLEMVESCMSYPIYPAFQENPGASDPLRAVQGARPGDRLSRLAELSSGMRCFKGSVMLWCGILARMRSQWDALEAPLSPEAPTHRVNARGTRTEFFDRSVCLVQQKMELLERSIVEQQRYLRGASQPEAFYLAANGEQRRAPELLPPSLLTEDVLLQRDTASASLDSVERAELCGKEMRSDMAAFKEGETSSSFSDFVYWRQSVLGLSMDPFPEDWLQQLWDETEPKRRSKQES
ncbi:rab3gap1 [Symbiodinium necroappetens]|uniref:Rab3 GTPase-activating protein catalytic subunit n=1 Tax=Symbiodinium necroappetens TaxID=1628268 RepID=A0A812NCU6_9DINO|nr:rab3gap1 [Symbiodinium necroappetens]